MKPVVLFEWINDKPYQEIWDIQAEYHNRLKALKLANKNGKPEQKAQLKQNHHLIFCEHSHVFTLGRSGSVSNLLLTDEELHSNKIEFFNINRGGDITYHGPGQITGYPIFDLEEFFTDVHRYVRLLEEGVIHTLAVYGLMGIRIPEYTGVWLAPDDRSEKFRKICAIGVHLSRWVSMHGFAFNVNTDLSYFDKIVPCGIQDENKKVTSLAYELGREVSIKEVGLKLSESFAELFDFKLISI